MMIVVRVITGFWWIWRTSRMKRRESVESPPARGLAPPLRPKATGPPDGALEVCLSFISTNKVFARSGMEWPTAAS